MEKLEKQKTASKYRELFSEKNYMLETLASIISRFGDGIDTIAFSLLVYEVTGSTLLVATLFAVNGIPNIIFGMVSGVACKYVSDKKIMAICDFGRFAGVFLVAILFITKNLEIWHLYCISFMNSSFESFRGPASMSIVPKIIRKEKLEHGIAFASSGCKIAEVVGLAIAPVVIGILGLGGAVLVDAITFLICGILIVAMKVESILSDKKITVKGALLDLKEGFSFVRKDKLILFIVVFCMIVNGLIVPLNALQAPYVKEVLNSGEIALSIIGIAILLGMIVFGIFSPSIKEKMGSRNMILVGGIGLGIAYFLTSLIGYIENDLIMFIALGCDMFILGGGVLLLLFPLQIVMFKKVPQEFLPRVAAIVNAVGLCIVPIMASIVGVISEFIDVKTLFSGFGIACAMLFLLLIFSKTLKRFDEA